MLHRRKYLLLKQAKTKPDLASILGVSASFLTKVLYKPGVSSHYHQFKIPKKSGGERIISAPSSELKDIQRRLSILLQDCREVIHFDNKVSLDASVSHGFERNLSIVTNAEIHRLKKNVLNLDLENFFESFNFGRVRGYFISNKYFSLDPNIATVIAQIACFNNSLPQGSPCSPVITNLITNSLDIRLVHLARKNGCAYSRYADDITFSTRKERFPNAILKDHDDLKLGSKLLGEIRRSGFAVNTIKTRLQYRAVRQEVTGLSVNRKVNVPSDYWRTVRAMAHNLFTSGFFTIRESNGSIRPGTLNELEGRLTFIDSIDKYNNVRKKSAPIGKYEYRKFNGLFAFRDKLNSREIVYSRFLHYKLFYANKFPTILTEGKTDNVYLKSALSELQSYFPKLVNKKNGTSQYSPKLTFPNLNKKTMYFLDIGDGATPFLRFLHRYETEQKYFHGDKAASPVILILDNDDGPKDLIKHVANKMKSCPNTVADVKKSGFLHLVSNLYLILTPLEKGQDTMMEDLFFKKTLRVKLNGKSFTTKSDFDENKYYGKHLFSTKVVRSQKSSINFRKFKYIFNEIEKVIEHFKNL